MRGRYYDFEAPEIREWEDDPEYYHRCPPLVLALGVVGIAAAASCRPRRYYCRPRYYCGPRYYPFPGYPYGCYPYTSCSPTFVCYPA